MWVETLFRTLHRTPTAGGDGVWMYVTCTSGLVKEAPRPPARASGHHQPQRTCASFLLIHILLILLLLFLSPHPHLQCLASLWQLTHILETFSVYLCVSLPPLLVSPSVYLPFSVSVCPSVCLYNLLTEEEGPA